MPLIISKQILSLTMTDKTEDKMINDDKHVNTNMQMQSIHVRI